MKYIAYSIAAICLFGMILAGESQAANKPVILNIMLDMDSPASPTEDQLIEVEKNFIPINNAMSSEPQDLNYTLFLVRDVSEGKRLYIARIGLDPSLELGISGNHSNEKLSTKPYEEQEAILRRNKEFVTAAKVCGTNVINVKGFKPQSFDQNEDTYKALDELGIEYNTGFQAGILYAPGHENDVWPYKVEGHKFYAVPVSFVTLSGEKMPLDDRYAMDKGLSGTQWYDLLANKLDEVSGKDEPMVVSLSTSVSGQGEYLDAYKRFIDYAKSKEVRFANTIDLVNMARSGSHEIAAMPKAYDKEDSEQTTST
jgi:hypothetical protein